jgi:protein-S-isoprenylcysteine O-methyltransferase Ste14
VIARQRTGLQRSFLIAGLSGVVLPIHAAFAFAGSAEFHLPVSIAVIIGTFVVSIWQAILTWRARTEFTGGA